METTKIHWELTDTFGGESNYSWVKRGVIETPKNKLLTNLATVRKVKKELGWQGVRCKVDNFGDQITITPSEMAQVCFVTFSYD